MVIGKRLIMSIIISITILHNPSIFLHYSFYNSSETFDLQQAVPP